MEIKGVYTFTITSLHTTFLHSTKPSGYKIGIKCDNNILAAKYNNHASKIVNAYIVFDLGIWSKLPLNSFTLKNTYLVQSM